MATNNTIKLAEDVLIAVKHFKGELTAEGCRQALGKSYWGSGHLDCVSDFYRCLQTGERFAQDLDGVRDTARLMLAAYRSAGNGGRTESLL